MKFSSSFFGICGLKSSSIGNGIKDELKAMVPKSNILYYYIVCESSIEVESKIRSKFIIIIKTLKN